MKILIVDDEDMSLSSVKRVLKWRGIRNVDLCAQGVVIAAQFSKTSCTHIGGKLHDVIEDRQRAASELSLSCVHAATPCPVLARSCASCPTPT